MAGARAKRRTVTRKTFYFLVMPLLALALAIVTLLLGPYGGAALWVLMGLVTVYIVYFEEGRKTYNPVLEGLVVVVSGLLAVVLTIPETRYVQHRRHADPKFGGTIDPRSYEEHLKQPGVRELNTQARRVLYGDNPRGPRQ